MVGRKRKRFRFELWASISGDEKDLQFISSHMSLTTVEKAQDKLSPEFTYAAIHDNKLNKWVWL